MPGGDTFGPGELSGEDGGSGSVLAMLSVEHISNTELPEVAHTVGLEGSELAEGVVAQPLQPYLHQHCAQLDPL